jgi:murein DD-endopeptidase MepM/ murein hydrolase activator NlpD
VDVSYVSGFWLAVALFSGLIIKNATRSFGKFSYTILMKLHVILALIFLVAAFFISVLIPRRETVLVSLSADSLTKIGEKLKAQTLNALIDSKTISNYCAGNVRIIEEDDKKLCLQKPRLPEKRGIEVDLTKNKVLLIDDSQIVGILPLGYQSPPDKWFKTPTSFFRVGLKKENHFSSIGQVFMPFAIQFYEDFFIHGIPYYSDGKQVSSNFTGGCLRLAKPYIQELYKFAQPNDLVMIYETLDHYKIKSGFHSPIDLEKFFIRQRFNSPYKKFYGLGDKREEYYQHSGVDFAPNDLGKGEPVYAVTDGEVVFIQPNDSKDHGLGTTVIIAHQVSSDVCPQCIGGKIYSLYAHLDSIAPDIILGRFVKAGQVIGRVGNTAYGCNYWRVGKDGCNLKTIEDNHLHFELKTKPVLESPVEDGCANGNPKGKCYGYVPDYAENYGYLDPMKVLFVSDKTP